LIEFKLHIHLYLVLCLTAVDNEYDVLLLQATIVGVQDHLTITLVFNISVFYDLVSFLGLQLAKLRLPLDNTNGIRVLWYDKNID
jgi:hypothetical protein